MNLSAGPSRPARPTSFVENGPPSSQYHPDAGSWTARSFSPCNSFVWSLPPEPTTLPAVQPFLQKPVHTKPQQKLLVSPPAIRRVPVIVDLLDDDENTPPPQLPPAINPHVQPNTPAQPPQLIVRSEPLGPRQQIAAARLKYCEQMARQAPTESEVPPAGPRKIHETIDLTLDD